MYAFVYKLLSGSKPVCVIIGLLNQCLNHITKLLSAPEAVQTFTLMRPKTSSDMLFFFSPLLLLKPLGK